MKVPNIKVTDIIAGLCEIDPSTSYEIPRQAFSAIYIPETKAVDIAVDDAQSVRVEPGGMLALPNGHAHSIRLPGVAPSQSAPLQPPFIQHEIQDDVGPASGVVLAFRVPTSANPMPDIIPKTIHLNAADLQRESQLDLIFKLVRDNVMRPELDRTQIMHRLAEIVAIILVEYVLRQLKSDGLNTFGGISDPQLRRALLAIHESPEQDWTLTSLAAHAGLSRSVFADRFRALLDQTPMSYLANVRMARATRRLRSREDSISEIAHECGYQSDASFHKAFKRLIGVSPSEYRKAHTSN